MTVTSCTRLFAVDECCVVAGFALWVACCIYVVVGLIVLVRNLNGFVFGF